MSEVKEIQLHATTTEAIEKIRPTVSISEAGQIEFNDSFQAMLPEKWTVKDVKEVQGLINTFEAAANFVAGEKFVEAGVANKALETAAGKTHVGRDTYNVSIARQQSIPTGIGSDAGRRTVYANVTSSVRGTNPEAKRVTQLVRGLGERLREN